MEYGGCAWQSEFTDLWDCSPPTTSRRLSALADENEVVKITIGRRNLICLPGHVPEYLIESEEDTTRFDDPPEEFSFDNKSPQE